MLGTGMLRACMGSNCRASVCVNPSSHTTAFSCRAYWQYQYVSCVSSPSPPCRSGRDLVNMAKQRPNIIPIIEDARHPQKYRMLVPMVDVVFADVAQPDQARIVGLNAQYFLKNGGNFVISIKASCIDSTAPPEAVFAREVKKLQEMQLKPKEQVTLEPYERDHAMVVGVFRPPAKKKE